MKDIYKAVFVVTCILVVLLWFRSLPRKVEPLQRDSSEFYQRNIDTLVIEQVKLTERIKTINTYYNEKVIILNNLPDSIVNDCLWAVVDRFDNEGFPKVIDNSNTSRTMLD